MRRRRGGFTLIEMLVVIAVVAILAAISIPAALGVRRRSEVNRTRTFLAALKLAIENYANDFGDYPPSRGKSIGFPPSNGVNEGIECLVRCLATQRKNGPYFSFDKDALVNLDDDRLRAGTNPTGATFGGTELWEIKDPWDNPFIYIHNEDYDRELAYTLRTPDGTYERKKVKAIRDAKTKEVVNLRGYQVFSVGPNGQLDGGEDDDVLPVGGN